MEQDIRFKPTKRRLILVASVFGVIPILAELLRGETTSQESLLTSIAIGAFFAIMVIIVNYTRVTIVASEDGIEGPSRWLYFPVTIPFEKIDLVRSRRQGLLSKLFGEYVLRSTEGSKIVIERLFLERRQLDDILALIELKQKTKAL